jgi:hypothetical protein
LATGRFSFPPAARTERVPDLQKNFVTIEDYERVVEASGFDDSHLHLARNPPSF